MTERMMQPIYRLDVIWNLTNAAKRLKKYHQFGKDLFDKVCLLLFS